MNAAPVLEALAAITPAEWLAVALALAYLVLAVRQNIACWLFAASSAAIYLWLFARIGLVMQSALQVFYIAMAAYGWQLWRRRGAAAVDGARPVSRWPPRAHAWIVVAILAATVVNGWLMRGTDRDVVVYVDAFIAWGSIATTWMVARKVLENWLYWIVLDLIAAGLYWTQGLAATAALFLLYAAIAVRGYRAWQRSLGSRLTEPGRARA